MEVQRLRELSTLLRLRLCPIFQLFHCFNAITQLALNELLYVLLFPIFVNSVFLSKISFDPIELGRDVDILSCKVFLGVGKIFAAYTIVPFFFRPFNENFTFLNNCPYDFYKI